MTPPDGWFDGCLAASLPLLAWYVLFARSLHAAVMLFVAFGMLSALSWARLAAPDIALVEASVSTGLTGALLMHTLGWVEPGPARPRTSRAWPRVWSFIASALLTAMLGWAVLALPISSRGLGPEVEANLAQAGASHPVTAVLLNFRGYDTLLEVAVLLLAVLGTRFMGPEPVPASTAGVDVSLMGALFRLTFPVLLLVAGYLVWVGAHAPGGAFQAGAVLAGGGVLALVAKVASPPRMGSRLSRSALLAGPALFAAVAVGPLFTGGRLLGYPRLWVKPLLLAVECALCVSIAMVLWMFFPAPGPDDEEAEP